jgi:hypothetical protein
MIGVDGDKVAQRPLPSAASALPKGAGMFGQVVGLFVVSQGGGAPQGREFVELGVGVGVLGDRYANDAGFWSDPRWPDQEVTLVEEEVAVRLGVPAGALRRNIVTRATRLDDLIDRPFRLGHAELRGIRPCAPCRHLEELLGRPGLAQRLRTCGGLRAAVTSAGRVSLGDHVQCPSTGASAPHSAPR